MLFWAAVCFVLFVMTYGINRTLSGVGEVTQTAQDVIKQGQTLSEQVSNRTGNLPDTVVPRSSLVTTSTTTTGTSGVSGASEELESQVGGALSLTGNFKNVGRSDFIL